jgi:hypothetical protein
MAWQSPPVWAVGDVMTAARLNLDRDNFIDLDRRATVIHQAITAGGTTGGEPTTSTTYADLATVGPTVSVEIGSTGRALVTLYAALANDTSGAATHMSFTRSGASTAAAADDMSIAFTSPTANAGARFSGVIPLSGLTPGVTTFTAKYRVSAGTGKIQSRRLSVTPLGS